MIAEERIRTSMGVWILLRVAMVVVGHMITINGLCIEIEGELRWNSVLHHI